MACTHDRDALVALYESTNGESWRNSVNWLSETEPIGKWFGVSVDGNGCVLVLYLDNNELVGSIPPELGSLAKLDTLDLDGNELSGEIPTELGSLSNLTVLSMDHNELSGPIPPELGLGKLAKLEGLHLDNNQFSGSIPPELGNLVKLEELHLDTNQLTGEIPRELTNLTELSVLYVTRNQLTGRIPPALLNVDENDLDDLMEAQGLAVCAPAAAATIGSAGLGARISTTSGPASTGAANASDNTEGSTDSDSPFETKVSGPTVDK